MNWNTLGWTKLSWKPGQAAMQVWSDHSQLWKTQMTYDEMIDCWVSLLCVCNLNLPLEYTLPLLDEQGHGHFVQRFQNVCTAASLLLTLLGVLLAVPVYKLGFHLIFCRFRACINPNRSWVTTKMHAYTVHQKLFCNCVLDVSIITSQQLKHQTAGKSLSLPCISPLNRLYCFVLQWLTAHQRPDVLHVCVHGEADGRRSGWSEEPLRGSIRSATVHWTPRCATAACFHHTATGVTKKGLWMEPNVLYNCTVLTDITV